MDMDVDDERETFMKELFLAYLLSWIIHDDQVTPECVPGIQCRTAIPLSWIVI